MNLIDQREVFLQFAPWCVDDIKTDSSIISISGWAVPYRGKWASLEFFINNERKSYFQIDRVDLIEVFTFWKEIEKTGFNIVVQRESMKSKIDEIVISRNMFYEDRILDNYYFPLEERPYLNLPPSNLRSQVHGSDAPSAFILEGFSSFRKLDMLFKKYLGQGIDDPLPILDWGCGCGRVSRYLKGENEDFYGVDTNYESIHWCRENLPGNFEVSSSLPPLYFPNNYFHAIYGVSILTHLNPNDQFLWIKELLRITRVGGVIILSFHGIRSLLRFNLNDYDFNELNKKNFVNLGRNTTFDLIGNEGARYYDIVQTKNLLISILGGMHCDIFFHEGVIGNHQDVLVLKKLGEL